MNVPDGPVTSRLSTTVPSSAGSCWIVQFATCENALLGQAGQSKVATYGRLLSHAATNEPVPRWTSSGRPSWWFSTSGLGHRRLEIFSSTDAGGGGMFPNNQTPHVDPFGPPPLGAA